MDKNLRHLRRPQPAAYCQLNIKVVPGASRDRIAGRYGEGIKVQVSAPPEKGKANDAVISVIAAALGLREADVVLLRGHASPRKVLQVNGLTQDELNARLERFLSR